MFPWERALAAAILKCSTLKKLTAPPEGMVHHVCPVRPLPGVWPAQSEASSICLSYCVYRLSFSAFLFSTSLSFCFSTCLCGISLPCTSAGKKKSPSVFSRGKTSHYISSCRETLSHCAACLASVESLHSCLLLLISLTRTSNNFNCMHTLPSDSCNQGANSAFVFIAFSSHIVIQ